MLSNNSIEQWKAIPEFPGYEASSHGRIRSRHKQYGGANRGWSDEWRVLIPKNDKDGYQTVTPFRDCKQFIRKVHHLVLLAFVGPKPDGMVCRHLDGNRQNNRADNLKWGTHQENSDDRFRHGTTCMADKHYRATISNETVLQLRAMALAGVGYPEIAKRFGMNYSTAVDAIVGRTFQYLPGAVRRRVSKAKSTRWLKANSVAEATLCPRQ